MIQVTRQGLAVASSAAIEAARERFLRDRCVRLPDFFEPALRTRLRGAIAGAPFETFVHPLPTGEVRELDMRSDAMWARLHFLVNDPHLFAAVRAITGCGVIGSYIGRVYKMVPGMGHVDEWHADVDGNRLVALSVNLTDHPYDGGVLQIMDWERRRMIHEVANTGFGDAILFDLAPSLRHRVTPVTGSVPKLAFAGWFGQQPDYRDWFPRVEQMVAPATAG